MSLCIHVLSDGLRAMGCSRDGGRRGHRAGVETAGRQVQWGAHHNVASRQRLQKKFVCDLRGGTNKCAAHKEGHSFCTPNPCWRPENPTVLHLLPVEAAARMVCVEVGDNETFHLLEDLGRIRCGRIVGAIAGTVPWLSSDRKETGLGSCKPSLSGGYKVSLVDQTKACSGTPLFRCVSDFLSDQTLWL
jgi:hypothetical protein